MERLTTKVDNLYQTNDKFTPLLGIKRLGEYEDTGLTQEEIEDLKIYSENLEISQEHLLNECAMARKKAKSEAIKEFAMSLKSGVPYETGVIRCADVDDLVKEMTED